MIYGWQSVSESGNQPADRAASRTGTACIIPCASAINAGIILIRSIRDPRFSALASTSLLLSREIRRRRSSEEGGKREGKKTEEEEEEEEGCGEVRSEGKNGASY